MKKLNLRILIYLPCLMFLAACGAASPTNIEQATAAFDTATSAPTHVPSPTPTEVPGAPGKLLNPCALMPADEVEDLFSSSIRGDYRLSIIVPTTAGSYASNGTEVERERALYECQYRLEAAYVQNISLMIEVFENADDARAEMEASHSYYDGVLQAQGPHPMAEISDLGEKAYSLVPISADELPDPDFSSQYFHIPIVYFVSGNYLVSIIFSPYAQTAAQNNAYYEQALVFARNALANLPENIHSAMADQDYHLDESWQPAGKPTEPCELVTREEAQGYLDKLIIYEQSNSDWGLVFGGVGYGDSLHPFLAMTCSYITSKSIGFSQGMPTFDGIAVSINQVSEREKELYITHNQGRILEGNGIGEAAFRDPGTGNDLVILQGNWTISLHVEDDNDLDSQFQTALDIAQLILRRFQ